MKISPSNLAAQLSYRGRGNPWNTKPVTAISNCFPGLEFDFRVIWRRMFEGLTLIECHNLVVDAEPPHAGLKHHRLLAIEDPATGTGRLSLVMPTKGVPMPGYEGDLGNLNNKNGVSFMEWANSLARIHEARGRTIFGYFTAKKISRRSSDARKGGGRRQTHQGGAHRPSNLRDEPCRRQADGPYIAAAC
ncbi:hypothetical protein [Bradyrhizobium ottawaense]|uniref:hypothetical protein n=1 Tax=Bradyrhizobium ottawaense TaxID=931866 RepID=UPI00351665E3